MPEGDALLRAARRLQPLVGQRLEVVAEHPRARATQVAQRIDGRLLESVDAVGKNLVFQFEGGIVLRSHLRMSGRWSLRPRGDQRRGTPWLVLRGERFEGVLWNGPVPELHTRAIRSLGPDILEQPPRIDAMVARLRARDGTRWVGEALMDQSAVAGIGNMWLAESLWESRLSPWRRVRDVPDTDLRLALETAANLMSGERRRHRAYRRAGMPCPRCRTRIRSWVQGDANRMTYWCPTCQVGEEPRPA